MVRPQHRLPRAWYSATFADFAKQSISEVIGVIATNSDVSIDLNQRAAWEAQIHFLKQWLTGRSGHLLLEFNIPRMGLRADAVLLLAGCVVILEFKVGEDKALRSGLFQVWEYALDTKNFHEPSHHLRIIPVLVPTKYSSSELPKRNWATDSVCDPFAAGPSSINQLLDELEAEFPEPIDTSVWIEGRYKPTPTIIEAARHLYANHNVTDIVRTEAGGRNITETAQRIETLIEDAKKNSKKIICFVTGVPGAGKTLIGLNVATSHRESNDTHAVFLSGNGPLVEVLREALTRDDVARRKQRGERISKVTASKPIKAFIQNVHHFRDAGVSDGDKPPTDRIVIFDEAQRAWNKAQTSRFMQQRKGLQDFDFSEPEFLINYMNRHEGWAVIICLVGGGQEIHRGEDGISGWINACLTRFPHWQMCISNKLTDAEYDAAIHIRQAEASLTTEFHDDLHLTTSVRSFRAEKASAFVKALLDCEKENARTLLDEFRVQYPVLLTRDLQAAKDWAKHRTRGTQRCGLLTSSKAMRLKPHAIDVRVAADPVHYFLGAADDTRSSQYLEDCATEFQVQGLELDWTVVTWDADFRHSNGSWSHHDFRGNQWLTIRSAENMRNLKNSYRVLLTRARQGMVIFVPRGDASDPTRSPNYYDPTYAYLRDIGIDEVS